MGQTDGDRQVGLIRAKFQMLCYERRPLRISVHIVGGPDSAAGAALVQFDRAAGFDIDDRARREGQGDMGVERQPKAEVIAGRGFQERAECWVERRLPVAVTANVALVECGN